MGGDKNVREEEETKEEGRKERRVVG